MVTRIREFVEIYREELFFVFIVIIVGLIGFGLGRLSLLQAGPRSVSSSRERGAKKPMEIVLDRQISWATGTVKFSTYRTVREPGICLRQIKCFLAPSTRRSRRDIGPQATARGSNGLTRKTIQDLVY